MPNWTNTKVKQLSRRLPRKLATKRAIERIPASTLPNAVIEPTDPVGPRPKRRRS